MHKELCSHFSTYKEVIVELNNRGYRTVSGKNFNTSTLLKLRQKLDIQIIKPEPPCLKYYIYKITCNYPKKCQNFIYYGKHQSTNPYSNSYMGGGELLTFAQKMFGIEFFAKEIVAVFDSSAEAEKLESEIVDKNFIQRTDNFNMSLGGKNSRLTQYAHPLKHRILEYIRHKKEAYWKNQKVWEYRRDLNKAIEQVYLNIN